MNCKIMRSGKPSAVACVCCTDITFHECEKFINDINVRLCCGKRIHKICAKISD